MGFAAALPEQWDFLRGHRAPPRRAGTGPDVTDTVQYRIADRRCPAIAAGDQSQERGLERLVLFSDAVVAIALTLLILPLTDVEIEPGQTLMELLRNNSGKLLAFGISFAVIARYWRGHHSIFKDVRAYDGRL